MHVVECNFTLKISILHYSNGCVQFAQRKPIPHMTFIAENIRTLDKCSWLFIHEFMDFFYTFVFIIPNNFKVKQICFCHCSVVKFHCLLYCNTQVIVIQQLLVSAALEYPLILVIKAQHCNRINIQLHIITKSKNINTNQEDLRYICLKQCYIYLHRKC